MVYTQGQEEALAKIKEFIASDADIFILKGYAGTGKTTLLSPVIGILKDAGKNVKLMAPTGRAANVLSSKTGADAVTIHKSIYELSLTIAKERNEENESEVRYVFPIRYPEERKDILVGVVDEASMVSSVPSASDVFQFGSGDVLKDLLDYFDFKKGAKLIFVGDPAQLPPVGDKNSNALDESFFRNKGYKVMSSELTDIVRQDKESAILDNAVMLRCKLAEKQRNRLEFKMQEGEFESIDDINIADTFLKLVPIPDISSSVIICYSNAQAVNYNQFIRKRYFGSVSDVPQKGDVLIVIGNNYSNPVRPILNGEFVQVIDVSEDVETLSSPVYIKDIEGNKRKTVTLQYRDVRLRLGDGQVSWIKIVDSLLRSNNRDLDYHEICAVYINFKIRHPELKSGTEEFKNALSSDPYLNALKVKYGYAITGHKSQGGEWDTVFVDFRGRAGLNDDCLRWCYTAITRSVKMLYAANIPEITPMSGIHILPAKFYKKMPDRALSFSGVPENSFHREEAPAFLKAKYGNISVRLSGSGFNIDNVECFHYRERYSVSDTSGNKFVIDGIYSSSGIFKDFKAVAKVDGIDSLLSIVNMPDEYYIKYDYTPSCESLKLLQGKMMSVCDDNGIVILNILEEIPKYKVLYVLRKDVDFFYAVFSVDKIMNITSLEVMLAPGMVLSVAEVVAEAFR